MGMFFIIVLIALVVYVLINALMLLPYWWKNHFTGHKNKQLSQKVSSFFVRKGDVFTSTVNLKAPSFNREHTPLKSDIILVLDYSGSMGGEPEKQVKSGAKVFVDKCDVAESSAHIGIVAFNHNARIEGELSFNEGKIKRNINNIPEATGMTSISEGLKSAHEVLRSSTRSSNPDVERIVILLSDGGSDPAAALLAAEQLKGDDVNIYCIGVENANQDLLRKISGGNKFEAYDVAFYATNAEGLVALFERIQEAIEPATAKNITLELDINHKDLILAGTESDISYKRVQPTTWDLPWLKESGEDVEFRLRASHCTWGPVSVNQASAMSDVLRMEYEAVTPEGNKKESVSAAPVRYVYITPTFGPDWFWVLAVNPFLWKVISQKFCSSPDQKKYEVKPLPSVPVPDFGELPTFIDTREQGWHPTLCIGLGGSGIATALRLRAFIADASGGSIPENRLMSLYIDSEQHHSRLPVFGAEVMDDRDFIGIGADLWQTHLMLEKKRHNNDESVAAWYDSELCGNLDRELFLTHQGASRVRQLGRLSLYHTLSQDALSERLLQKIDAAAEWLADHKKDGATPKVFIFCAATGGTGGAIFQDISHLLMQAMQQHTDMASQPVDLIVPDLPSPKDDCAIRIYESNKAAFLLELERLKSMVDYPYQPKHSDCMPQKTIRFTNYDYLVAKGSDLGLHDYDASALLALCQVSKNGPFAEQFTKRVPILKSQRSREMASLIRVGVTGLCPPVSLIEHYADASFVLNLLHRRLGIELNDGLFNVANHEWVHTKDAVRQFFIDARDYGHDQEAMKHKSPLLFSDLFGLATRGDSTGSEHALVISILSLLGDHFNDDAITLEVRAATPRVLEWLLRLMNREDIAALSTARALLLQADACIAKAYDTICRQDVNAYKYNKVLYFTPEALRSMRALITRYREMIQQIDHHLSAWIFALAEGFPSEWGNTPKHPDNIFVGTARRFARRQEIQRQRMTDYPTLEKAWDKCADDIYSHRQREDAQREELLHRCVSWALNAETLALLKNADKDNNSILSILAINPFTLTLQCREVDSVYEIAGASQDNLEDDLLLLAAQMRPWLRGEQMQEIMAQADNSPPIIKGEEQHIEAFRMNDDVFPKDSTKIQLKMSFGDSFRDSNIYTSGLNNKESSAAWKRGERYHVYTADAYSATFQKAVAQSIDANILLRPQKPTVVFLLQNMHRLQKFLYICLMKQLTETSYPGNSAKKTLLYRDDHGSYYLNSPRDGETSMIDAAVQYVLDATCIDTGKAIALSSTWRPAAEELEILNSYLDIDIPDSFLDDFDLVLKMMAYPHHGGYIARMDRLSSDLR